MSKFNQPKDLQVLLVEPSLQFRKAFQDALRARGIQHITSVASVKDAIEVIESEQFDWIVTNIDKDEKVNGLQLLKIQTCTPQLRGTRISLFLRQSEDVCLPLAFELGLISYFDRTQPGKYVEQVSDFFRTLDRFEYEEPKIAASYLRKHLHRTENYAAAVTLDRAILQTYPGSPQLLLNLAESYLLNNHFADGAKVLNQVKLFGERYEKATAQLQRKFEKQLTSFVGEELDGSMENALGIECCYVIDPDTAVQFHVSQYLDTIGVPKTKIFSTGLEAWRHLDECKQETPDLIITEWRLPELDGPQLVQRIANAKLNHIPILVISSLLTGGDLTLTKELGITNILPKPFEHDELLLQIIHLLQQDKHPTEQAAMEHKIRLDIQSGNLKRAERKIAEFCQTPHFSENSKIGLQAEFAFGQGDFQAACQRAATVLKNDPKDIRMMSLLARSCLKNQDIANAATLFEKLNHISPDNLFHMAGLISTQLEQGNTSAAESTIAAAKQKDAGNALVVEGEAKIALVTGDTQRARNSFALLDSLSNVISFMNNRAVVLTRQGKYDDGISLYLKTVESLPDAAQKTKQTVSYNLALAYARKSNLEEALNALANIDHSGKDSIGKKIASLKTRLMYAVESGVDLVIESGQSKQEAVPQPRPEHKQQQQAVSMMPNFLEPLLAEKGDICLYRIYFAKELITSDVLRLVMDRPNFKAREAIDRGETLQVKPGAS